MPAVVDDQAVEVEVGTPLAEAAARFGQVGEGVRDCRVEWQARVDG